jgi:hypothetical protein
VAETFGILLLCATGLVCIVAPCLAVLAFMAWLFLDQGAAR